MLNNRSVDFIWLLLMALTLMSAALAETAEPGLLITLAIAASVAFKGRMVVDRFMELQHANRHLRAAMRIYFYVIPLMIVLVFLFPEQLARITTL
jgi:hypothetical protein